MRQLEKEYNYRHRHPQHAAGGPCLRLDWLFLAGRAGRVWVDDQIFANPAKKQTEDYITGRAG